MESEPLSKKQKRAIAKEKKFVERKRQSLFKTIKKLSLFLLIGVALGFLGFKFIKWVRTPGEVLSDVSQVNEGDWIMGNREALVTLIEYSDFACPSCAAYSTYLNKLDEEHPEKLKIIYRHFPLISIHDNSSLAAQAAEAAGLQGKFWEMHDMLFEKQDDWKEEKNPVEKFSEYARDLNLDEDRFLTDLESKDVENKVKSDLNQAVKLRLNYTPTLFLNGEIIQPSGYEELKSLVEEKI
jgi:protein-disulfide isomerase